MRLVLTLVLVVLVLGLIGFLLTNLEARVDVTVWAAEYPDVHVFWVVLVSMTVGMVAVAIVALVEGAAARLDNRKLRREVHKAQRVGAR